EPGAIIVDETEFGRLGVRRVGDTAEVGGRRVRVVDTIRGYKSIAGPYVFCSTETARALLKLKTDDATFLLARCKGPADAQRLVQRLRGEEYRRTLSAFTSAEFSLHSQLHWLFKTKAGIALGCSALLGLLVGAVVTSQTLYAATAASLREYA